MVSRTLFSSAKSDWGTPLDFFIGVDSVFNFDLDACASLDNTKCSLYYSKGVFQEGIHIVDRSAFKHPWHGNVWINPPYGRGLYDWVEKAYNEVKEGNTNIVVMLIPARTDTKYYHDFCKKGVVIFLKGRIKFEGAKQSAPFPSMLVIFHKVTIA